MIKTTESLINELNQYKNPQTRISRMEKQGSLLQVKRGIYEDDRSCPPEVLAGIIYGPSYLSFEFALEKYGLIPERTAVYTSATLRKNRTKKFSNIFGAYTYRDIPAGAYPYGITMDSDKNYSWLIACPEKALCDTLYKKKAVSGIQTLKELLFDSLRIEEEDFFKLDQKLLLFLSERYTANNLKLLGKWLRKREGVR